MDARKVRGVAFAAQAPITCVHYFRRRAASGAEAMPPMPIDHRLGLTADCRMLDRHARRPPARVAEVSPSSQRSGLRGLVALRIVAPKGASAPHEAQTDTPVYPAP